MSKGNMFLGGARGSVGDVTLQVLNGQQITKRRNRNPKNPKTKKQMYQRASFAEPVKFFTRGQQNLFKFAFENKANGESDYNAFMRVNAKLGVLMTKQQIENPFIAKFGNFCLTQGSMTGLSAEKLVFAEVGGEGVVGIQTNMLVDTLPTTVGELSAAILDSFKSMQNGDIITTLQIVTDNLIPGEIPYVVSDGEFEPIWYINQIILDRNDSTPLASAWSLSKSADGKLIIANADALSGEEFCGCSLIISRNIPGGVKVSTSYVKNSDRVQQVIDLMKPNFVDPDFATPWAAEVLASWSATDEAILQGSLAPKAPTHSFVVSGIVPEQLLVEAVASEGFPVNVCDIYFDKIGDVKHSDIKLEGNLSVVNAQPVVELSADGSGDYSSNIKLVPIAGSRYNEGDVPVTVTIQGVVIAEGTVHFG